MQGEQWIQIVPIANFLIVIEASVNILFIIEYTSFGVFYRIV